VFATDFGVIYGVFGEDSCIHGVPRKNKNLTRVKGLFTFFTKFFEIPHFRHFCRPPLPPAVFHAKPLVLKQLRLAPRACAFSPQTAAQIRELCTVPVSPQHVPRACFPRADVPRIALRQGALPVGLRLGGVSDFRANASPILLFVALPKPSSRHGCLRYDGRALAWTGPALRRRVRCRRAARMHSAGERHSHRVQQKRAPRESPLLRRL
jgi:hypothetical protein